MPIKTGLEKFQPLEICVFRKAPGISPKEMSFQFTGHIPI